MQNPLNVKQPGPLRSSPQEPAILPPATQSSTGPSASDPAPHLAPHRFKPGQSGNPGGLKKGQRKRLITDALIERLEERDAATGKTMAQLLAGRLLTIAVGGGNRALDALVIIIDRTEGKVPIRSELSGPEGGPVAFEPSASREEMESRLASLLLALNNKGTNSE
jgi:hypothetical protein